MNNEIKEILEYFENNVANNSIYMLKLDTNEAKLLLDYITNLQQNYERIYNENCKLREGHNITDISLLDENHNLQQEINKLTAESTEWESKYYEMQDNFHNANEEIERQSKAQVILDNMLADYKQENKRLKEANKILEENWKHYMMICAKATEFIKEKISSTKGVINDYMYHKEHNQHLIELLQEDIEMYKKELNILQNGSDE